VRTIETTQAAFGRLFYLARQVNNASINPLFLRFARGLGVFHADERIRDRPASRGPNGPRGMGGCELGAARQKKKDEVAHNAILVQPIGMYKYA
jgi:hypothetical protein